MIFIQNCHRGANEHVDNIDQVKNIIEKEKVGRLLRGFSDRYINYGSILNGLSKNFFDNFRKSSTIKKENDINFIEILNTLNLNKKLHNDR